MQHYVCALYPFSNAFSFLFPAARTLISKPCPPLILQVIVLDSVTLEEVGVQYAIKFSVQRLDYRRSMMYRITKLQAAIQAQMDAGAEDPFDLPEV